MKPLNNKEENVMKNLGKYWIILMFLATNLWGGSVYATVNENQIIRGDLLLFTISVVGEESDSLPSIEIIEGFPVESILRDRTSSYEMINGKTKMIETLTTTFIIKPTKSIVIPAFQVRVDGKNHITKGIKVDVFKKGTKLEESKKYFLMEMKLNEAHVFLDEPLFLTVYFKQKKSIYVKSLEYKQPSFKGFFVKQVGKEKKYEKDGYAINEIKYLLSSKQVGHYILDGVHARVAQLYRIKQPEGWYADVEKWNEIKAKALRVDVLEVNVDHDMVGDYELGDKIDKLNVKPNKPVTLNIEISGEGNLEDFEDIEFDIPEVLVYASDAHRTSQNMGSKLTSRYQRTFTFVAEESFDIPSLSFKSFNKKRGKIELLKTKSYHVEVEQLLVPKVEPEVYNNIKETKTGLLLKKFTNKENLSLYLMGGLMFLLGILSTLFVQRSAFMFKRRSKRMGFNGVEALQILYPKMSDSVEVEEMVRKLYAIRSGKKNIVLDTELLARLVNRYRKIEDK